ncbi:related to TEL1 - telomere length control protein [Ustilago trichophora]|uniref:Serine/threonine-protein kinase TEL1 n=1 Tax=Ustilago trichophora TaxID=86804 RepID=A0A5C3EBA3_9BASI|nr:related to TEL1 - telomere length control protein [Ustilago trichophora]
MAFSLQEALEQIRSDKIKDRQQGLEALEHIFADLDNVINLDPKQDGKAWLKTFQSLFACVLAEKAACIRKGSFHDAQPVAIARLQRAAQMLRSLVDKAAPLLTRKVVKALVTHILQMLNHRGTLFRPVAPAYSSALCSILKQHHHVDHLDPEDWSAAASLCFAILLGRDLDAATTTTNLEEWLPTIPNSVASGVQRRGLSLEDAVTAECLRYLMACSVAPLLGPGGLALSLLADYTRFLLAFPVESSAHLPAITGLVFLLEHLELNNTRQVVFAALSLRNVLLGLCKSKNQLLKIQLLLLLRIVVPLIASLANKRSEVALPQDPAALHSLRTEAITFLELVHDTLLRDPDTRWALEPVRIDALVFRRPQNQQAELSCPSLILCNSAFFISPYSSEQDTMAWCRVGLQVDIIDALMTLDPASQENGASAFSANREATHDELPVGAMTSQLSNTRTRSSNSKRGPDSVSSSPRKRRRTTPSDAIHDATERVWMQQLIQTISNAAGSPTPVGSAARLCALQLMTFIVLDRPHLIDSATLAEVRRVLLLLAADTDGLMVPWSLVGLGAIVLMYDTAQANKAEAILGSPSSQPGVHAWGIAVRKLQSPDTCRAAAFLLATLLAKGVLSEATLQSEISRLLAEVDLQGPPILCDSVCHLMTLLLHRTNSTRTYQHLDPRRKIGAWFASTYSPADAFQSPSLSTSIRSPNTFLPYHDLLCLVSFIVADRGSELPDSAHWLTDARQDDIAQLLRRRARSQHLRDLALKCTIIRAQTAQPNAFRPDSVDAGPPLLSMEAFNRIGFVVEKKVDACLDMLKALTSDTYSGPALPCEAAIAAMHAAVLMMHISSLSASQTSSPCAARIQRACHIIIKSVDVASRSKSLRAEERNLVIQQLNLLAPFHLTITQGACASTDLLCSPSTASGIAAHMANSVNDKSQNQQDPFPHKRLWMTIREADMLEAMLSCFDQLLERTLFGDEEPESNPASAAATSSRDAFDDMPESGASNSNRLQSPGSFALTESTEAAVSVAVRLLGGVPRMLTGNADSRREELIVSLFFDCPVEGLISISPVLFDSLRDGNLWMSQRDLVDALDRIGTELLTSYRFARNPAARVAAVHAVSAVVPLLLDEFDEQSDLFDKVQKLATFFAEQIGRIKWPTPWEVQLECATFLSRCMRLDPEGRLCKSGSARGTSFSPQKALLQINADPDIRVRGLGSSIAASVFDTTSTDEEHISEIYNSFREGLPSDSSIPQHILTRALSLCNVAIANSAVRRSALFHLLEIVLATGMFPITIQQLFALVATRLGFSDASSCYQAFAGQITWGMATNNYDPLQVPWKMLGFTSKRECLEATFSACGSMLLAAQTPEGRTQFDALVQLTRRTQQQGLQECLPFLTAAYLGFAVQAGQQEEQHDLPVICRQTLHELSLLGFAESADHVELRQMITNADDLIVTTVLSLYFEPGSTLSESRRSAIVALTQHDAKIGSTLSALTPPVEDSDLALHEPSRPFFPAVVTCAALSTLPNLGIEPFRKDVIYNVLRHVFHQIASCRFINDQLRLCAALRIYIAMCGDSFWSDQLNAQGLVKSIEQLLDQQHLHNDLRFIFAYACNHSSLTKESPETLVSCIVTWSVQLKAQITQSPDAGDWLFEAARAVAKASAVATSATALLWPVKLTSTEQVAIESLVDIETLVFALEACPRISLQLPSLLRIRTVLRKAPRARLEAFCNSSSWKLLESMAECRAPQSTGPSGDSQSDVMSDIFGCIMGFGETALLHRKSRRIGAQGNRSVAEAFLADADTSQISSLCAAIVLTIHQLAQDLPVDQGHQAFKTLRNISAAMQHPLTEVHATRLPVATREELSRIRPSINPLVSGFADAQPEDLLDPALLEASASSDRWICRISAMLCDLLSSLLRQSIFLPVRQMVSKNADAAKALFPLLLLSFTVEYTAPGSAQSPSTGKRRTSGRRSDPQAPSPLGLCRAAVASHFEKVLESRTADPTCSDMIVQALLALRALRPVQEEPDKVCYWFDVDTSLLAKRCIACGLFSAAIFFVEHNLWEQDESQSAHASLARIRNTLLHQAYMNIDDPDAFYGITDGDVRELLLRRLHHEGQWLRAFQYHAADYEASMSDGVNSHGAIGNALGQSLSQLGFQHLYDGIGSNSTIEDRLAASQGHSRDWNATSWDLPTDSNLTSWQGRGVEAVLQTLRQASTEHDVDRPLSTTFQLQLQALCSIPVESVAAMRRLQGDLLALGQIKVWRKASASLGPDEAVAYLRSVWIRADVGDRFEITEKVLNTRRSVLQAVRQRMQSNQIGDVLDGAAEQAAKVERSLLVLLSRQAREHEKLQKAINATARAERIEIALGDDANLAREEFAAVLWDQQEHPPAIQLLSQIVDGLDITVHTTAPQKRRVARLMALLAQWRATARSQHPREIDRLLFEPALKLIASSTVPDVTTDAEQSEIAYRWARFAEEHHRGTDMAEITRLRVYIDRRGEEISQNQREFEKTSSKTERGKLLQFQRQAEKILRQDETRLAELEATRTHFLRRSVVMYARALASSDTHDDAVARLISLWFENAADAELNRLLASCLSSIPSRKFVALMHQLSARLTEVPNQGDSMAAFQSNLTNLLLRMCQDHPFHCLYAIFALIKTGADAKAATHRPGSRSSLTPSEASSVSTSPQILRSTAAEKIWNQIKRRSRLGKRIRTFEELCLAYVEWAEFDLTSRPDRYFQSSGAIKKGALRMPPSGELRLARLRDLDVPVATARLELDHTSRYENFVSIVRYSETFTTAGGIHLPKISECIGSDGERYKQLFKRDDDLRQDAVMQQVFRMVNELLHANRRTRERKLVIRTYTVLPLGPQCGMLEFVTNTVPLGEVLIALHARYRPNDLSPTQARSKMRDVQPLPAEAKLEAFLDVCEGMRPAFRYFFSDAQRMPRDWYETRLRYTRSVSTNSIVGHVLGLGDRHVSNILLDKESGELVHIDFGVAFDQGKLLPIPELVPFRLTRDIVDGMGINGVEGTFRRCCEETLQVLRAHQDVIKTVLEVFRHDPLFAWTSNPIKVLRAQEADESMMPATTPTPTVGDAAATGGAGRAGASRSTTPFGVAVGASVVVGTGTAELSADRAVTSVMSKLSSSLSVEYTVNDLIQQAMDAGNLSAIFHGWQAAL